MVGGASGPAWIQPSARPFSKVPTYLGPNPRSERPRNTSALPPPHNPRHTHYVRCNTLNGYNSGRCSARGGGRAGGVAVSRGCKRIPCAPRQLQKSPHTRLARIVGGVRPLTGYAGYAQYVWLTTVQGRRRPATAQGSPVPLSRSRLISTSVFSPNTRMSTLCQPHGPPTQKRKTKSTVGGNAPVAVAGRNVRRTRDNGQKWGVQ